ncbi:protein kinase [Ruania alkalisoli]|uniref:non-specific serine/threonine protein kinase n=1 Tax=Ruania alkalisoli TaxID=2779775 RepID=A0A7M1SW52_9MICO|nr:serine/threonine-protein kinase [Ruania alkalisoli]QOR70863.1 protein kinase [Ruania alkalisoli]
MTPTAGLLLGGRYELTERLATGGMGEIWVATDLHLRRHVAAKVLRAEFAGDTHFLQRLRTEARNSAALSHQNIAAMYDYGEQRGSGYLIMELVIGESLEDLLRRERTLEPAQVLPILAQTARALHTAHMAGVVHRDVKPSNILLTRDGYVKITDFGISLGANQAPMTAAGMVMGTAQYLPPEQAMGRAATGAGDIYALGVVAFEALAGRRPFTGSSQVDIAFAHVNQPVPPLPSHLDERVQEIVMQMLAKDPEQRPRSAASLARALETLTESLRVPLAEESSDEPPATAVAAPLPIQAPMAPPDVPDPPAGGTSSDSRLRENPGPTADTASTRAPAQGVGSGAADSVRSPVSHRGAPATTTGEHRRTLAEAARQNPLVAARARRPSSDQSEASGRADADSHEDDLAPPRWRPVAGSEGTGQRAAPPGDTAAADRPVSDRPTSAQHEPPQNRSRPSATGDPLTRRDLRSGVHGSAHGSPRHGPVGLLDRLGRTGRWIALVVAAVVLTTLLVLLFSRLGAAATPSAAVVTLLVRPVQRLESPAERVKER